MDSSLVYVIGLAVMIAISFAVVFYLHKPLFRILVDLCETNDRAQFWTTNSHILLVLVPLLFAMIMKPAGNEPVSVVFVISSQLSWGLFGLIGTLLMQSLVINMFIPRRRPVAAPPRVPTS